MALMEARGAKTSAAEQDRARQTGPRRPRLGDQLRTAGHHLALWDERPEAVHAALRFANKILAELDAHGLLDGEAALCVRARTRRPETLASAR